MVNVRGKSLYFSLAAVIFFLFSVTSVSAVPTPIHEFLFNSSGIDSADGADALIIGSAVTANGLDTSAGADGYAVFDKKIGPSSVNNSNYSVSFIIAFNSLEPISWINLFTMLESAADGASMGGGNYQGFYTNIGLYDDGFGQNLIEFAGSNGGGITFTDIPFNITLGREYSFIITVNDTNYVMLVDGVEIGVLTGSPIFPVFGQYRNQTVAMSDCSTTDTTGCISPYTADTDTVNGTMRYLRVYNEVLNSSDITLLAAEVAPYVAPYTGLVRQYAFDNSSNPVQDLISAQDGFSNATWTQFGVNGTGALTFGSGQLATVPVAADIAFNGTTPFSMSFAFKTNCDPGVSHYECYAFVYNSSAPNTLFNMGSGLTSNDTFVEIGDASSGEYYEMISTDLSINLTDGNWHQVVMVFNGSELLTYIDGVYYPQTFYSGNPIDAFFTDNSIVLGNVPPEWNYSDADLSGSMDNFCMWNRSLSATEAESVGTVYDCNGTIITQSTELSLESLLTFDTNTTFNDGGVRTYSDLLGTSNGYEAGAVNSSIVEITNELGQAVSFQEGIDAKVNWAPLNTTFTAFTFCAVMQLDSQIPSAAQTGLIDHQAGSPGESMSWFLFSSGDDNMNFEVYDDQSGSEIDSIAFANSEMPIGVPFSICLTYDGSSSTNGSAQKVYINNTLVSTSTTGSQTGTFTPTKFNYTDSLSYLTIDGYWNGVGGSVNATWDEVYFTNSVLTGVQIQSVFPAFTIYVAPAPVVSVFSSTWNTTKNSTGSSDNYTIVLPIYNGGTYNFTVDWGDGSQSNVTSYTQNNHTYVSPGVYTINISGEIVGWRFNSAGDRLKIININSWGPLRVGNSNGYFAGCANLNSTATDNLNLTGTTDFTAFFSGATIFNGDISGWDTSQVTTMAYPFLNAAAFNQPIGSWSVGKVTSMNQLFNGASSFNQPLNNWDTSNVTQMQQVFSSATSFNQPLDNWNTSKVTSMFSMFLSASSFNQSIGNWDTSNVVSNGFQQMFSSATSFDQDISNWSVGKATTLASMFQNARNFSQPLNSWDTSNVTTLVSMFNGATRFNQPLDNWNTGKVTTMSSTFSGASAFNGNITSWNTVNVTTFASMFNNAASFNQPIGIWDIHNATTIASMFSGATSFNQPLNSWNTSKVTTLASTFSNAQSFNQPLNSWDTSKVTLMSSTFANAWTFNSDISSWNTSLVTTMSSMFFSARVFDQPIGNWDTRSLNTTSSMFFGANAFNQPIGNWSMGKVTNMNSMFLHAVSFNQNVDSWNTANVTTMSQMFQNTTVFNQPLNSWNTGKVTTMGNMFAGAQSFNQPLNNWNTGNVTTMSRMFGVYQANATTFSTYGATNFNQDLSSWNTGKVASFANMFEAASSFDQNIGSWNISLLTNANGMFDNVSISTSNYDSLLIGWASQPTIQNNVNFSGGGSQYTSAAVSARSTLSTSHTWNMVDGGLYSPPAPPLVFSSTWDTTLTSGGSSNNDQVMLPLQASGTYNFTVDWGDGNQDNITVYNQAETTHTYSSTGVYTINITGEIVGWRFANNGDVKKITGISSWGPLRLGNGADYFQGANNLVLTTTDALNLTGTTNLDNAFSSNYVLGTPDLSSWDVSQVTTSNYMFGNAFNFNGNISNWDMSSNTNIGGMFSGASAFNQDISGWDVSGCTDFSYLFEGASSFNQPINSWDVSGVTNFNSALRSATAFNQPLNSWVTSSAQNMNNMFLGASNFNQDISGWNMVNVYTMSGMFQNAPAFNQDISGWNTQSAQNIANMFNGATAFNQNLSTWNVSQVTSAGSFIDSSGITTANYNSILIGWAAQALQSSVTLGAQDKQYSGSAEAARNVLTTTYSWTVNDAGCDGSCVVPPVVDFVANVTSGTIPLSVQFTDLSNNTPTSWAWDFQNDGIVDNTTQNPVFEYSVPGTYDVNLTATNAGGSSELIKSAYITVNAPSINVTSSVCDGLIYPNEKDVPSPSTIQFNFTVVVVPAFNNESYNASIQRNSGAPRSAVCSYVGTTTERNYTCNVTMNYYTQPGQYTINVTYSNGGLIANYSNVDVCTYGQLLAMQSTAGTITFPSAGAGIPNVVSSTPLIVENTGNTPLTIQTTGRNLVGVSIPTSLLNANAFKAGLALNSSVSLVHNTAVNTTSLNIGYNSTSSIWLWLSMPSTTVPQDYYSQTSWQIGGIA